MPATALPEAIDRLLGLLLPDARPAPGRADVAHGYLDLVREDAPASSGRAQDLMLSRALPVIYERAWRPVLGRLLTGVRGTGTKEERRIARLLLGLRPGDGVLDVACGPGNFTRDFARVAGPGGLVVGLDASPTMLARAVSDTDHPGVGYVRGDAEALPFKDASFDAVSCFAAMYLFGDPERAVDEMIRVLAPGGRLALFTSCALQSAPGRTATSIATAGSGLRIFERDEVVGWLEDRGMQDVSQRVTGLAQYVGARKPR